MLLKSIAHMLCLECFQVLGSQERNRHRLNLSSALINQETKCTVNVMQTLYREINTKTYVCPSAGGIAYLLRC